MSTVLTAVGTVITSAVGWVGSYATAISSDTTGILIIPFVMGLSLFGIHIMKSLMGR